MNEIKKTIALLTMTGGLFMISCSDNGKAFIGKHTINIPLVTTNYDTTKTVREFGLLSHPEVHYYDLYTSTIDIYKTEDNKLAGQIKFVYPENKMMATKLTISEQMFELKNLHMEKDTLNFLIQVGPMQGRAFEGCVYEQGNNIVVGLPKKLFNWIHKNHCTETLLTMNADYVFLVADQPCNKKELYKCQVDSFKAVGAANPNYVHKYELSINYLTKMVQ